MTLAALSRRLLVRYLVTVGLVLGAAEYALYLVVKRHQRHEAQITLRKEVERISSLTLLDAHLAEVSDSPGPPLSREPVSWQVLYPDGGALGWSSDLEEDSPALPALGSAEPALESILVAPAVHRDEPVLAARLRTLRVRNYRRDRPELMPPQMVFDIRATTRMAVVEAGLDRLRLYLAAGFPLFMGLVAFGGRKLIRQAVHPVKETLERERRFAGAVSHELRTPLTALRGEVEIALRRPRPPSEYAAALRVAGGIAEQMSDLVEDLLLLARAESGSLLLGAGSLSVGEMRQRLAAQVAALPDRERIALDCSADEDARIRGDAGLLSVAARNLIENALRHDDRGRVHVRLRNDADGHGLLLIVEDEGKGFPAEVLAQIADGQGGLVRKDGHTRFGLTLARAVAEAHRGRLALENLERGARVSLRIPYADPEEA